MIFNFSNPYDKSKAVEYFRRLLTKDCIVELKECKPKRSNAQNSYLHVILGYFACEYGCSLEEAKVDFYKRECNRDIFEVEVTNRRGRDIKVLRSSATLDTREMTLTIERFRNWAASVAGIYLPSPNEEQFLNYCLQEIERNRDFV